MEYSFCNVPRISLSFDGEAIKCSATYYFSFPTNSFRFFLGANLTVTQLIADKKIVECKYSQPQQFHYFGHVREITIREEIMFSELEVRYKGPVRGWCTTINEDVKAICCYSAWYPLLSSQNSVDYFIEASIEDEFELLNGISNGGNIWSYGCGGYDIGNILAINKNRYMSVAATGVNVLYRHNEEARMAKHIHDTFTHAGAYYSKELYKTDKMEEFAIVTLGIEECGAYVRNGLIVFPRLYTENSSRSLDEAKDDITVLLLHEIAHTWCKGAGMTCWEDWLNETTAEWSAMLYLLDNNRNDIFNKAIKKKINDYVTFPQIRTLDGERPDGVHDKGTVLFYCLYQQYGIEVIRNLLREFVSLQIKDTNHFIESVRNSIGNEVAESIMKALDLNEYAIVSFYEFGTKYSENWNWNFQVSQNVEVNMRIGEIEVYSINAFVPQGSPPPKIMIYIRPCSIKKYLQNKNDIEKSLVDYTCFGSNLDNCDVTITVNEENVTVTKTDRILEVCGDKNILCYLLQVPKPANISSDTVCRLRIVIHDNETDEDGEGVLYANFIC